LFKSIKKEELKELVLITSEKLSIKYPSIIEKDYHVTQIIHALAGIENEFFCLIFAGGTCLAKAHKIVKRMSEDIDFKIKAKFSSCNLSMSQLLKELKKFRTQIISSLSFPDLSIIDSAVRNEGKYLRVDLAYPALFSSNEILRPHLLLEFTLSDVRLPTNELGIKTIIEDVINIDALSSSASISCISTNETAIEKWVSLTRRISAIEREYHYDDQTLVRHLYDLNAIKKSSQINHHFFDLGKIIVDYDAKQFKNQHPEYSKDPRGEIEQSLSLLKIKPIWKTRYNNFIEAMVYDKSSVSDYDLAIHSLENLSAEVFRAWELSM
jgi:predicted nucleotidyltransferase component of viral defense system